MANKDKESEYFANMFAGNADSGRFIKILGSYFQQMTMVNFLLLTKLIQSQSISDQTLKESRIQILKQITDTIKKQLDTEVKEHTKVCEESVLGTLFSGLTGDGEDMRLNYSKAIKKVEEAIIAAIEAGTEAGI